MIEQLTNINQRVKTIISDVSEIDRQKLHPELIDMIFPFQKYLKKHQNVIFKCIWDHFMDQKFHDRMAEERKKGQSLIEYYASKNNKIHVHGCN